MDLKYDAEADQSMTKAYAGQSSTYPLERVLSPRLWSEKLFNNIYHATRAVRIAYLAMFLVGAILATVVYVDHSGFYSFQTFTSSADKHYAPCAAEIADLGFLDYKHITCPSRIAASPFNPLRIMMISYWTTFGIFMLMSFDIIMPYLPFTAIRANGGSQATAGTYFSGEGSTARWARSTFGLSAISNSMAYGNPNGIEYLLEIVLYVGFARFMVAFTANHDATALAYAGALGGAYALVNFFATDSRRSIYESFNTIVAWVGLAGLFVVFAVVPYQYSYGHYIEYTSVKEDTMKLTYWFSLVVLGLSVLQQFSARVSYWYFKGQSEVNTPLVREVSDPRVNTSAADRKNFKEIMYEAYPHSAFMPQFLFHNGFGLFRIAAMVILTTVVSFEYGDTVNI